MKVKYEDSLTVLSLILKKPKYYIQNIKATQPLRFRAMQMFGKSDLLKGYNEYERYKANLYKRFNDIRELYQYDFRLGKYLCEIGLYSTVQSGTRAVKSIAEKESYATMDKVRFIVRSFKMDNLYQSKIKKPSPRGYEDKGLSKEEKTRYWTQKLKEERIIL